MFALTSRCGNSRASWNTWPIRRRSTGTSTARAASNQSRPSRRTWPLAGRTSPAIALTSVVLPAPDAPNNAVTPGVGQANRALSSNGARRTVRSTSSTTLLSQPSAQAAREQLGEAESGEPEAKRQRCETRRRELAAGRLQGRVQGERQGLRL